MRPTHLLLCLGLLLGACGGDDDDGPGADAAPLADGGQSDASNDGFELLASGDWTLPAGTEDYFCVVATVPHDVYVQAFKPLIPQGTHHTVVTRYNGPLTDGIHRCNSGTNGFYMIYGSGVGSPIFQFPPGVAIKLNQGEKILINLHLFNSGETELSGTSGTYIKPIEASQVENEAELVLMGPTQFSIPPGQTYSKTGTCTLSNDINVFAVSPHMHRLGTHLAANALVSGQSPMTLWDGDYDFDAQSFHDLPAHFAMHAGDKVQTTCTWSYFPEQPNAPNVTFGESTNDEMCFASVYYYPRHSNVFVCDDAGF